MRSRRARSRAEAHRRAAIGTNPRAASPTHSVAIELLDRELQRRRELPVRIRSAVEAREQLAQRDARPPGVFDRQARLEIRLRLPPQLRTLAEHAERVQQCGVIPMLREPALRL